MASASTSELSAGPAGSSEEPGARADVALTGRDVHGRLNNRCVECKLCVFAGAARLSLCYIKVF